MAMSKAQAGNGNRLESMTQSILPAGYSALNSRQRKILREGGLQKCASVNGGYSFYTAKQEIHGVQSIYGVEWELDLFVWHPTKLKNGLVVECKWQHVCGSADDKLVFSVFSLDAIQRASNGPICALMLDGAGVRGAVRAWVEKECAKRSVAYFTSQSYFAQWAGTRL